MLARTQVWCLYPVSTHKSVVFLNAADHNNITVFLEKPNPKERRQQDEKG
jgi:hypothetical protein